MEDQISVLLVDDHVVVRNSFRRMVERAKDITVIAEAASGEEAVQHFESLHPDVVVMDISMPPGISGIDAMEKMQEIDEDVKIVFFSMLDDSTMVESLYASGATGYIPKDEAPNLLVKAVRAAHEGKVYVMEKTNEELMKLKSSGEKNPKDLLTAKQYDVFVNIAEGLSNQEIAEKLNITLTTLNNHINSIYKLTGLSTPVQIARKAISVGIIDYK